MAERHPGLLEEAPERPAARGRAAGWLEVALFAGLLVSYIWLWQGAFPGSGAVVVALYLGAGAWIHRRHGESIADLGLGRLRLAAGLWQAVVWVGPLVVAVLAAGAAAGSWHFPPPVAAAKALAAYAVWGTLQQYGLLCVLYRRLDALLPGRRASVVAAGLLFGAFHVPNVFLVVVTVALGSLSAWLYRRVPNALALGLAHGVLGAVLTYALPAGLTLGMRVGPGVAGR